MAEDPAILAQQLKTCRDAYGDSFVGYAVNEDPNALDSIEMTEARAICLGILSQFGQAVLDSSTDLERDLNRSNVLGPLPTISEEGLVSQFRHWCGGDLPTIEAEDEVESLLLTCVRDCYPALLLPLPTDRFGFRYPNVAGAMFRLKNNRLLQLAILRDTDLRRLFPGSPSPDELDLDDVRSLATVTSQCVWMSGEGGGSQLVMLPESMVTYALVMAGIHGTPSYDSCARYARIGLDAARSLARGEQVGLPLVVGMSNINFSPEVESIKVRSGILVPPTPSALARLGLARERGRETKALFIASAEQCLLEVWPSRQDPSGEDAFARVWQKHRSKMEAAQKRVQSTVDRFRYALLLASPPQCRVAPHVEVITRLSPLLSRMSAQLGMPSVRIPSPEVAITPDIADAARLWSERVEANHPISLDIGMRRLLSAATLRIDPMDGFIDAVMCWENLFGEALDTAFKVCGSLAMLLEPDDVTRRASLFSSLKKLYVTRSELVHGSSEPNLATAHRHRDEALDVALRAMRAAYDVEGLLSLKNSVERYKRVLLGLPSPTTK